MEPFITIEELSAYVHRSDLTGDLKAEIAVGSACETLKDFLNQDMEATVDDVAIVTSAGTDSLLLPQLPVRNVSKVEVRASRPDIVTQVVDPNSYWVDLRDGILWTRWPGAVWLRGNGMYQVTYSHGWSNPVHPSGDPASGGVDDATFEPVPRTLSVLALHLAARIYEQGLVKSETVGMYQSIYSVDETMGFSKNELNILAKYRPGR